MRAVAVAAVAIALLLQLGACGSSDDPTTSSGESTAAAPAPPKEEPVQAAEGGWQDLKRFAGSHADKLIIPQGPSPDHVVIRDIEKGKGPAIEPGDLFTSHYISFDYANEEAVEPSPEEVSKKLTWVDAGSLVWGIGDRVPGWEPGLKGVQAGGLRELIVPARLAYGNNVRVYLVKVDKIEP